LEVCALRISLLQKNLIIACIYRSPTGDFPYFIKQLDVILNRIYKAQTYIILCGDCNINHLVESNRYNQLQSLLASHNLFSTVTFPTIITSNTSTLIDNIYGMVWYCIVLYLLSIHQIHTRCGYRTCQGKYKLQLQFRLFGYKISTITTRNMSIK